MEASRNEMDEMTTMIQALPAAVADWGLDYAGANDESSRNLRGLLMGVPIFAGAVYAPIVHPGLAVLMMLAGAIVCCRPLIKERRRIRRENGKIN